MLAVVGTLAFDTLANVPTLAPAEHTGRVRELRPDEPGGTAGNVAMAFARLGGVCRIVSSVGPEFSASSYASALRSAGVDLDGFHVGSLPTARAYVFHDEAGGQTTYFYAGASAEFRGDAPLAADRAHFCAGEIRAYPALMRQARFVSFDPGQELFHRDFAHIEACLEHADVLFANRHELDVFERNGWSIERLLRGRLATLVETRGAEGTLVHTRGGRFAAPGVPVRALDPTGAGDAHRAGYLFALERGADAGAAARFANVMGSFAVENVGAQTGLPTRAQALERYAKAYGGAPFS